MRSSLLRRVALIIFISISVVIGLSFVDKFHLNSVYLTTWPKNEYGPLRCEYAVDKVQKILDQPYTYLTKGRQFYVFASADGKYVLKFIKCQRVNVSDIYKNIPLPDFLERSRKARLQEKEARIERIFESAHLAATALFSTTGVVFAHLHTNKEVKRKVELIDDYGARRTLNIDDVPFIIQMRGIAVKPEFSALLAKKEIPQAEARFCQLINLMRSDVLSNVYDIDSGTIVRDNVAFLKDAAIHVDIGTLMLQSEPYSRQAVTSYFSRLDALVDWLADIDPVFSTYCRTQVQMAIVDTLEQYGS